VIYQTVSGGKFSPRLSTAAVDGLGFDVVRRFVRSVADLDAALADALTSRSEALFVSSSPLLVGQARRIAEFARRQRLPSAFIESLFVEAGGLVSYGSSVWGTIFDSLEYVDAILRGANPAELPIKLPTQMELAINLGVARELGLTVPRSILLRADRIVE
jgi:putative ABC transport system substrate-binding protein